MRIWVLAAWSILIILSGGRIKIDYILKKEKARVFPEKKAKVD